MPTPLKSSFYRLDALFRHLILPALLLFLCAFSTLAERCAFGDATLPQMVAKSDIAFMESESEIVKGNFPGLLLVPKARPNYRDDKYLQSFHAAVHVYIEAPPNSKIGETSYERRFVVSCQDKEGLPFARKVAKLLLTLCSERRSRFRIDHPANLPVVNVWITGVKAPGVSEDVGGEQFENQIYLHNLDLERNSVEWMREIAHEYGHYSLPGISGFKTPEEWANGMLGERLYLKWMWEDIQSGKLRGEELAFGTKEEIATYLQIHVYPAVYDILQNGVKPQLLERSDEKGMDGYVSLALYADTLYGSKILIDAMGSTHSARAGVLPHAPDFLRSFGDALKDESDMTLSIPGLESHPLEETKLCLFLPSGQWNVTPSGSISGWRCVANPASVAPRGKSGIVVKKGGWNRIVVKTKATSGRIAKLRFRRE